MPPNLPWQAVVLAGGDDKRLHPMTSSSVKALLPVANKPLLSYSLRLLAAAGLKQCLVVRGTPRIEKPISCVVVTCLRLHQTLLLVTLIGPNLCLCIRLCLGRSRPLASPAGSSRSTPAQAACSVR